MGVMTVRANQVFLLVLTAQPKHFSTGFFMTVQATRILVGTVREPLGTKADIRRIATTAPVVGLTGTVAACAGSGATAIEVAVSAAKYRVDRAIRIRSMTIEAAGLVSTQSAAG